MPVVGRNCLIIDGVKGRTCNAVPFDPSIGVAKEIPVVDAALAYDCPFTHQTYILIIRNAMHINSLNDNLIAPFILRESGLIVNEIAKIHAEVPTNSEHSIYCPQTQLRIPLGLNGIFSYFHTRKPIISEIDTCEAIFLTPDSDNWDPYSDHYSRNEDAMVDWEGNVIEAPSLDQPITSFNLENELDSIIEASISSTFIPDTNPNGKVNSKFLDDLNQRAFESKLYMSIGSVSCGEKYNELFVPDSHIDSITATQQSSIKPSFLSKIWNIKPEQASQVIKQNTHLYRQGHDVRLSRRFSTNDRMLRYKRINSRFFTDTFFVTNKAVSSRGNKCAQIFVSDLGYVAIYPMKSKGEFYDALHLFCKEIGVPNSLVVDPSGEQTSSKVKKFCHQVGTTLRILEESTQWANRAELYIGLFKESIRKDLAESNSPLKFWDYCAERRAKIHNVTPKDLFQLNGQTPIAATLGIQGDISNICQFAWYDWCYYREESDIQFPFQKRQLGRVLGPLKNEGNEMTQAVLTIKGTVIPRRSCTPLTVAEINSEVEIKKRDRFDEAILKLHGDSISIPESNTHIIRDDPDLSLLIEDEEVDLLQSFDDDPVDHEGKAIFSQPFYDILINAEVLLPQGEEMTNAKVIRRSEGEQGQYDENPLLNTILYDVEFDDGTVKQYAANTIAMNMYDQVDRDGYSLTTFDCIVDFEKTDEAIKKSQQMIKIKSGQYRKRKTTDGWNFLIRYHDDSEHWVPLKTLKETNPIDVAEFAIARGIDGEPAFDWWVPYTIRKRDLVISSINHRMRKTTHKYGVQVPRTLEECIKLDNENGNLLWSNAIDKEMRNVAVAFEILEKGQKAPVGWTKSSGHLVFDVKMDFTRKARWVKDGHRTVDPDQSTFAGVVSRESVRIALTYAALNDINVTAADIQNAYLQAPSSEKHYIICGSEFGLEHQGKVALIRRALYGGKSSGADFWKHLRSCMTHLGFTSCKADPDVWMREAQSDEGSSHWEYILLYVDDALCISNRGEHVLKEQLGRYFLIKPGSVGPPKIYLGNKVSKVTLENGCEAWSFSSSQYVQNAVLNIESHLRKQGKKLPKRASAPFSTGYRPELDISPELDSKDITYYQSLIGILRWIVELGRVDITAEVSMMASHMALPRQGHLEQLFHIFAFLKYHHNSEMVFDPSEPDIDYDLLFPKESWKDTVYGIGVEEIPSNIPEGRGFGFRIIVYVDSDHAGDSITRRSRTGFIVFLNNAPIFWTSKKQGGIETSSFASEFIAMKTCCEYVRGLRYKLRMMGIPCDFPAYVFGDNKSVLVNSSKPFSVLKKKSSSIAYHYVREGTSRDEWRTAYIKTDDNMADMLTKPLPGGVKRTKHTGMVLHHLS